MQPGSGHRRHFALDGDFSQDASRDEYFPMAATQRISSSTFRPVGNEVIAINQTSPPGSTMT